MKSDIRDDTFLKVWGLVIVTYVGYFFGRVGHMMGIFYNGYGPHHWLLAIVVIFVSAFFDKPKGKYIYAFGVGLLISDFNDFLFGNYIMSDNVTQFNFWGVN